MDKLTITSSDELRKITVFDNQERLVDLRKQCPGIIFTIAWYIHKNGGDEAVESAHYARKSIATKLNVAQSLLPKGLRFMIDCAYRSPIVQQKSWDAIYKNFKSDYPDWTDEQVVNEMEKRVSPVDIAPHCTGGAVDLTIVDSAEKQLDMGTQLDEFTEKTYTLTRAISPEAKKNRSLLIDVMATAGFVNFPAEWWHWSYGDREWGNLQASKVAVYGPIEK